MHSNNTPTFDLFHPLAFGEGLRDAAIVGGTVSSFRLTDADADRPEPFVAELALRWELNGAAVERVLEGVLKRVV